MHSVSKYRIRIVDPTIKREGRPPRDLTEKDIITVPVDYSRGAFRILDMIDNDSALALLKVYNQKRATA